MARLSSAQFGTNGNFLRRSGAYLDVTLDWTLTFWYYQDATTPSGGNFRNPWQWGDVDNGINPYIYIGSDPDSNNLLFFVYDGVTNFSSDTTLVPALNQWLKINVTYNSSTKLISFYIDVTLVASFTINWTGIVEKFETIGGAHKGYRFSNYKAWQALLTATEILDERNNFFAYRLANLLVDTPISVIDGLFPTVYSRDESGNGRNWALTGTLDYKDSPYSEGSVVLNQTIPTTFGAFTHTAPGTVAGNSAYRLGPVFFNLIDDGQIPTYGIVIYDTFANHISVNGAIQGPGGTQPGSGETFQVRKFNAGAAAATENQNGGDAGGSLPDASTSWVTSPQATSVIGTPYVFIIDVPDAVDPNTLLEWYRSRLFTMVVGVRTQWVSRTVNPILRTYDANYVSFLAGVEYAPVTPPAYAAPPFTTTTTSTYATIIVTKVTVPFSDTTQFAFLVTTTGATLFNLLSGQSQIFNNIPPGSGYSVIETEREGWMTTYAVSNGSPYNNISVSSSETVTVTVTNVFSSPFSGIYYLKPRKTNDTLYTSLTNDGTTVFASTTNVKFPDPRVLL